MPLLLSFIGSIRAFFVSRSTLAAENLALRQQLIVLRRSVKRPKLYPSDRVFWAWLSRLSNNWSSWLIVVKPETVIHWHRQGFKLYWKWKSRRRSVGRPKIDKELRDLIRQMAKENPLWGAPRIQSEVRLPGFDVCETTVANYMPKGAKPPTQGWRTFLNNHVHTLASIDFFVVPTATFQLLYCLVILRHERRELVHFNVTSHPTERWTTQQFIEAFPFDTAPLYLIRDRDVKYSDYFRRRLKGLGIKDVPTAPRSPWQNPFVERVIGSIRRECLDHVIVLNERHLQRILKSYVAYYHDSRTHLALDRNSPKPRAIEPKAPVDVVSLPQVGGLHHRYARAA